MRLVKENAYLYDVQVATCLMDAYYNYNCFGISFFIVSKVSKWNNAQWISFMQN
jgi:hypothetical protein